MMSSVLGCGSGVAAEVMLPPRYRAAHKVTPIALAALVGNLDAGLDLLELDRHFVTSSPGLWRT